MGDRAGDAVQLDTLFGVSAAAFGSERGCAGDGAPADQWACWQQSGQAAVPGAGCNLWAEPERALDLASALGCDVVYLPVEWARVEPAPGEPEPAVLDRYAEILAACEHRGLVPIVGLHDLAHPLWLGDEYWLTPGSPDRFADHVARVVGRLGEHCRRWVTSRRPNVVAVSGWIGGHQPPRRIGAVSDAWAVLDNLLVAHALAYDTIHELQPAAEVALGLRRSSAYECQRLLVDLLCAPSLGVAREELDAWIDERRAIHDVAVPPGDVIELAARRLAGAASPFGRGAGSGANAARTPATARPPGTRLPAMATVRARLRRPSPRRVVDTVYGAARRPIDALLVGWQPPSAGSGVWPWGTSRRWGRTPPWEETPAAGDIGSWCTDQTAFVSGLPLWVEDGFASRRSRTQAAAIAGADERPRAVTGLGGRPAYVRAAVRAVAEAAAGGIPISCYLQQLSGGGEPTWPAASYGLCDVAPAVDGSSVRFTTTDADGAESAAAYREAIADLRSKGRPTRSS